MDVRGTDDRAAAELRERTLTKLYNEVPPWLRSLHRTLDEIVAESYGWETGINDDEALASLLAENQQRGGGK